MHSSRSQLTLWDREFHEVVAIRLHRDPDRFPSSGALFNWDVG
jgi:hypothetical protein